MNQTKFNSDNLPNTMKLIYDEMISRKVVVEILSLKPSLIKYCIEGKWYYHHGAVGPHESATSYIIAQNKYLTSVVCAELNISHPSTTLVKSFQQAATTLDSIGGPIVVKPLSAAHGDGITLNVCDTGTLKRAIDVAFEYGDAVLLQRMVSGDDCRVVCINGKFAAAIRRMPATVTGDGVSTIRELIHSSNLNRGGVNQLVKISMNKSERYLGARIDEEVPQAGLKVRVVDVANLGAGGWAEDITETISVDLVNDAEKIAKHLQTAVVAVDFMEDSINHNHHLIEINASPGLNIHDDGRFGPNRRVIKKYVDGLFRACLHSDRAN